MAATVQSGNHRPFLMAISLAVEFMPVGGLLHLQVVSRPRWIVRPYLHAGKKVVLATGITAQHPVDHGDRLGPGDGPIWAKGPVGIALHPTQGGGLPDILLRPVPADIGEVSVLRGSALVKAGADRGELCP